MSYPIINGAPINEEGDGSGPRLGHADGIDLVSWELASGYALTSVPEGPVALKLGEITRILHNTDKYLEPVGMDLVQYDPPVVSIDVAGPEDQVALEIGKPVKIRLGTDRAIPVAGRDLVRVGTVNALYEQPGGNSTVAFPGARPFELGAPAIARGPVAVQAGDAEPLEFGGAEVRVTVRPAAGSPLEFGDIAIAARVGAAPAEPLEFGVAQIMLKLVASAGLDLVSAGTPQIYIDDYAVQAAGVVALEFGGAGAVDGVARPRSFMPLAVGRPSIDRGLTC